MGKRKGAGTAVEQEGSHKKHRKHKHKKHRREHEQRKRHDGAAGQLDPSADSPGPPKPFKLRLKFGGKTVSTKEVNMKSDGSESDGEGDEEQYNTWQDESPKAASETSKKTTGSSLTGGENNSKKNVDSEEEAWLDALEEGRIEDTTDLKRMKNPAFMTARQRALYHGLSQEEEQKLLQLPSGYKTVEMTEEMKERKEQRAKKRRIQAQKRVEENKKKTLHRLLVKQDKKKKTKARGSEHLNVPRVRYLSRAGGTSLSFPPGVGFPLQPAKARPPAHPQRCGVAGCGNAKRYSCSQTSVPLCSIQCYKKNLATPLQSLSNSDDPGSNSQHYHSHLAF